MSRTGYLIEVYMDANPYSETYGQERTERILDTEECKTQQPANYVHVYTYCEMNPNGSYTGNCVKVYEDVEPLSPTYGNQMEEVVTDQVLCPPDSTDADWQQVDQYCEQMAYQPSGKLGNSGYMVTVFRDMGEYSPTYNQTRETKEQDLVHCTPPSTEDVWVIISETCHLVDGLKDGTKDVVRVNTNEYSPNYNDGQSETINVEDTEMCPVDPTAPVWTETSYVCEQVDGYNTGYTIVTEEDTNTQSSTYGQTRTRRISGDSRCPVQTSDTIGWRIINNRSVSTDTITSITVNFNTNAFAITASGSLAPGGGQINGSSVIPAGLKSTALSCTSITLSPNASLPTLYQYSQAPATYTWDTDHASTLVITLWDGDGTGPEWTEVSYVCNTVDGYRDGSSTVTEQDMNPNSATYGQTRTRTVDSDSRCPAQTDADWVETSWSCQEEDGYNTGYVLSVQTDQNPNSSSYGQTRTRMIYDLTRCPLDTTAHWVEVSRTCQKDGNDENTGYALVVERDTNPYSSTYNTTRTVTVEDLVNCPLPPPTYHFKARTTTLDNVDVTIDCNSDPELTASELAHACYCIRAIVGDCVTKIGQSAFYDFVNLTSVTISDTVHTIMGGAFSQCTALTSINIPYGVTIISGSTFYGCNHLPSITLPETVTTIEDRAFYSCQSLESINIPSGVTSIGFESFRGCSSLRSIELPSGITSIGGSAFENCRSLNSVTVRATTPPTLGSSAFNGTNSCPIYVPAESVNAYKTATNWSRYASYIRAIPS